MHEPGDEPRDDESTQTVVFPSDGARRLGRLRLLVVGDGVYATHPLPESGDLTIGRSDKADVCIDDPLVSRRHAVLHVGERLLIEDLGSANGMRVRDLPLGRNETAEISPGDTLDIGGATLVVQRSPAAVRPRRVWTHGAFEARLEDECARAERARTSFALMRIHVEGPLPAAAVQELLGLELRSVDVIAAYGPDEYEVLLVDTEPERANEVARSVVSRLADRGERTKVGTGCYPRDGTAPEEIIARACSSVRGEEVGPGAPIVVADGAMERIHRLVKRIASGTISVLLLGETGVGKEVLAETLHRESPRASRPLLRLNCAALTESLLESELFGHERGAFTGALSAKPGLLETANGGTVFLDEVGDMPMSIQVKLLRVLEERQVYRVGAVKARPIDVRFIAATNRDLEADVAVGVFRQDLYFRLAGISLVIPPLRERTEEIEGLAAAFIAQVCRGAKRSEPTVAPDAMSLLRRYGWPGNIRELRNVMERAVLLCTDGVIRLEHLPVEKMGATFPQRVSGFPFGFAGASGAAPHPAALPHWAATQAMRDPRAPHAGMIGPGGAVAPSSPAAEAPAGAGAPAAAAFGAHGLMPNLPPETLRGLSPMGGGAAAASGSTPAPSSPQARGKIGAAEKQRILEALDRCAGNQTKAARLLGISRRTLVARLETYGLPRPRKNTPA